MLKNKQIPLVCLFLTIAPLIAFWQVKQCDFINYDDPAYVTENIHIQHGITIEAVRWAFTTGHAANWHPLTWMSHMLDVQLFGLDPRGPHLTNLLFHIANTLLFFLVFHRMTNALWKSAFVAALFALHPLHVQSVAWVAERKDVLSTFFWMLTMGAYVIYVEHRTEDERWKTEDGGHPASLLRLPSSVLRYLAVVTFFALGLMAKPMLVTLPFVLLLLDFWPLRRMQVAGSWEQEARSENPNPSQERKPLPANKRKRKSNKKPTGHGNAPSVICTQSSVKNDCSPPDYTDGFSRVVDLRPLLLEKSPLFALAALSCIVTYVVQQKGGAVKSLDAYPLGVRVANAFVSCVIYMGKTIWPNNLAVFYPHPGSWPLWQVMGAALLLVAITLIVILWAKRFPYLAVGWLWFAGTLIPVIGIVQVGRQAMADRYTYIPLIGLFIMAAWGIPELLKNWKPVRPFRKEALLVSSVLILACFSIVAWTQVELWTDSVSLYDHALRVTSDNDTIRNSRGDAYCRLGNLMQAIPDFDRAVEINPENAEAYYNRGVTYGKLGNPRRAIEDFGRAIEIDPKRVEPYYNRGFAWGEIGEYSKAIENYDRAIEIDSKNAEIYNSRGVAYGKLGAPMNAISDYDRTIEIEPRNSRAFNNRGFAYGRLGNYRQAIEDYSSAIEIDPGYVKAYFNRGIAYSELGRDMQAIEDMRKAARFGSEEAKKLLRSQGLEW